MQIKISTRHGEISKQTQQFIKEKTDRLLHIFQRLTMIEVVLDMKEEERLVELLVSAEHKHDLVVAERHRDVLTAVDTVVAKMEGKLRRYKEKIQDHRRSPSAGDFAGAAPSDEQGLGQEPEQK